jgi:2-keto-4-pentenoate hydratase/2-oxohepta-3-ene-1,7-dioic acid hydratase in catechol pathway
MKTIRFENKEITPGKIVCIGRNYVEHIKELSNEIPENMVVFNKPNSAVSDTLYYFSGNTRFEGELCFLIKKSEIAGVGFGLDLTHADVQNKMKAKGLPWERAKAFDASAVFGKFVAFEGDITKLRFKLFINGELRQFANYDLMMYKPDVMLREIQTFMHFEDGDIVMSGTPKGVASYRVGDLFEAYVYCGDTLLVISQWRVEKRI